MSLVFTALQAGQASLAATSGLAVTAATTASVGTSAVERSRFTAAMAPILSLALLVAGCPSPHPMPMNEGPPVEGTSQYCQSMVAVMDRLREQAQWNDQLLLLLTGAALVVGLVAGFLIGRHVGMKRGGKSTSGSMSLPKIGE